MLRVLGPLALAFASSACGAAGPERAAPSAERAPAAAAPSLDGTWLAFEADDERVRARLEIEGRAGVATLLRTRREAPLRVEPPRAGRPGRLDVGVEGRRERLLWVPRGPRRALGLTPEDDDLVLLLRAGPVPEALRGKWVMRRADRREAVARLRFGRDAISATFPGGGGSGEAFGLPSAGDARAVAVAQLDRPDSGRLTVLRMERAGEGCWVAWENGDDDYRILHRPGERPAWLPRPDGSAPRSVETPPPPGPAREAPDPARPERGRPP